ncbi:MAG: Fpg/Nei family DNA glycosylase [Candidatus Hodarchaeales archaeon]|jgi:formamidopyrimidine-DNA glycosylase
MPELPELEALREYLESVLSTRKIMKVETFYHTVLRYPSPNEFKELLTEAKLDHIDRIGRMLRFIFTKHELIIHLYIDHGLTGRLMFKKSKTKLPSKIVISLEFDNDKTLIYHDLRLHGAIWLYSAQKGIMIDHPKVIENYGPGILEISESDFTTRIKKHRGEIKGILTNQKVITGIGNAYSDEILFDAGIHPFTKRTDLNQDEIKKLYFSCRNVLSKATKDIFKMISSIEEFDEKKWRKSLFKVHLKGREACSNCNRPISTIKAKRVTNFCRKCQPSKNRNFI